MSNKVVNKVLESILENEKIFIPDWVKRVKIDIGTSLNAPFSEFWINDNKETCVFAFEPSIFNIEDLKNSRSTNSNKLNINKLNRSVFLINCALSNYISENETFFCANGDGGTSSLFEPTNKGIVIKTTTKIPVITLESFFEKFDWSKIQYIEQIKIDAQGSDLKILKGCGNFLSERIVYIDVETTTDGYYKIDDYSEEIKSFLNNLGFVCIKWGIDATFYNKKFESILGEINYKTLH